MKILIIVYSLFVSSLVLFVCVIASRSPSTAMIMLGRTVGSGCSAKSQFARIGLLVLGQSWRFLYVQIFNNFVDLLIHQCYKTSSRNGGIFEFCLYMYRNVHEVAFHVSYDFCLNCLI